MADITWRTTKLPDAILGAPYEASLAVTGNATAFTACTVTAGALPTGLSITADKVRITGTPTGAVGTYTCTITLTDTAGAVASSLMTLVLRDIGKADKNSLSTADKVAADIAKLRFP
jgi:hypothetical protein